MKNLLITAILIPSFGFAQETVTLKDEYQRCWVDREDDDKCRGFRNGFNYALAAPDIVLPVIAQLPPGQAGAIFFQDGNIGTTIMPLSPSDLELLSAFPNEGLQDGSIFETPSQRVR